jgi:putative peptidoglycan lipid II flippase
VVFTSFFGLLDNYLHYKKVFLPQIIVDYLQNIAVIIVIIFSSRYGFNLLFFGLLAGYILRCIVYYFLARRKCFSYESGSRGTIETLKIIVPVAIPVFLGTTIQEINFFVDRLIASSLPEGRVSALNYANQVNMLVMTISSTIITTLLYPRMASANSTGDIERFKRILKTGFNAIMIVTLPCSLGAVVFNKEIITLIYERGAFDVSASTLTRIAYVFFSLGLVFLSLNDFITRAYYSLHEMTVPMYFAAIGIGLNIALNIILVKFLQHGGLALSTSIAAFCNTILLYLGFTKRHKGYVLLESWGKAGVVLLSSILAIGSAYLVSESPSIASAFRPPCPLSRYCRSPDWSIAWLFGHLGSRS